ncbi:hypothetical protein APHAL10511_004066 [Amanita phalloides]|nr:hypothetical protein APHAL10511_004066 [Amanita phalloides]
MNASIVNPAQPKLQLHEYDELDCFSAMDPAQFYGLSSADDADPLPQLERRYPTRVKLLVSAEYDRSRSSSVSELGLRRSERARKPRFSEANQEWSTRDRKARVMTEVDPTKPTPRKRALSISALENGTDAARAASKKLRIDGKKAQTILVNERRDARDRAKKKWIYHHKQLFEPLLPTSSAYVGHVKSEVERMNQRFIVPFHELDEQPALIIEATLKDYQLYGLSYLVWMYKNGMNCILGDEMGLGKTLQTLSLFAWLKEHETGVCDPHLVICPLSVLQSWENEAKRWSPSLSTLRFHGAAPERTRIKEGLRRGRIQQPHIMFTTYEMFVAEDSWFKSQRWTYCVLDEGHKIKNAETNVSGKLHGIGSLYRLILTGTPVQNNLVELWSLLHWLYPNVFTDASERLFKDSFDMAKGSYDMSFLNSAKELVSKIMLRRTKSSVEINVPPREEMTIFIPLTEAQRFWTYRLLMRMDTVDLEEIFSRGSKIKVGDQAIDAGRQEVLSMLEDQMNQERVLQNGRYKKLMNLLMQLRKVCDHPYLLPNASPEPYTIGEHLVAASSKIIAIDKLLADILPKGERVLIFSQWTGWVARLSSESYSLNERPRMLDYLEDFLALREIKYARLDGSTYRPRRTLDIKLFQMETSPYQVFLISTRAGGLGKFLPDDVMESALREAPRYQLNEGI